MGKVSTTNLDSEKRSLNIQICGIVADPVHAVTKRNLGLHAPEQRLGRSSTCLSHSWRECGIATAAVSRSADRRSAHEPFPSTPRFSGTRQRIRIVSRMPWAGSCRRSWPLSRRLAAISLGFRV
jgi:hypothetical protein